jgi:hypothetical protein
MASMDYANGASAIEWVKVLDEILKLDFYASFRATVSC